MSSKLDPAAIERLLPLSGLVPEGDETALFNNVSVLFPMDPIYEYSIVLPDGWYRLDSPAPDWAVLEDRFSTLGVFAPEERPTRLILVSCGVIRMPEGLTVTDCFEQHCRREGFEVLTTRPRELLAGPVVEGLARRTTPDLDLTMRLAMFEDGGNLYGLAGMAPTAVYPDVVRELSLALCTFELQFPSGPGAPLT